MACVDRCVHSDRRALSYGTSRRCCCTPAACTSICARHSPALGLPLRLTFFAVIQTEPSPPPAWRSRASSRFYPPAFGEPPPDRPYICHPVTRSRSPLRNWYDLGDRGAHRRTRAARSTARSCRTFTSAKTVALVGLILDCSWLNAQAVHVNFTDMFRLGAFDPSPSGGRQAAPSTDCGACVAQSGFAVLRRFVARHHGHRGRGPQSHS